MKQFGSNLHTYGGMSMIVRDWQSVKAKSLIVCIDEGMSILLRDKHPLKISFSIISNLGGIWIVLREKQ